METFQNVISSIKGTTDAELLGRDRQQLLAQAVTDLSDRLRIDLGISQLIQPVTAAPQAGASGQAFAKDTNFQEQEGPTMTAEETKEETKQDQPDVNARFSALESRLSQTETRAEAAETELAKYKLEREVGDRYLKLKQRAAELNRAGKFSRFAFVEYFPNNEQLSDAVARFSRPGEPEGDNKPISLDEIEAALEYVEKFSQPIQTGSVSGDDPLPDHPVNSRAQAEDADDMARFNASRKQGA